MDWAAVYLGCFVVGLTFVGLAALVGHFGGGGHGDAGHGGHDSAGHGSSESFSLPLMSPMVLAVFVGMFGAGGLALLKLGFASPWTHVPGAAAVSASGGLGVAWTMMKLMRSSEKNSLARHDDIIGQDVEVVRSILAGELGEIAFNAGGSRQTLIAHCASGATMAQGDRARVLSILDGVALVAASSPSPEPPSLPQPGIPVHLRR